MNRRVKILGLCTAALATPLLNAGVARADDLVTVKSEGPGSASVTVNIENWCFGSPETEHFYCVNESVTVPVRLP